MCRHLSVLLVLSLAPDLAAQPEGRAMRIQRKLAVVVGVSSYPRLADRSGQSLHLPNAGSDARALASVLRSKLGFTQVREVYDPRTKNEIRDAVVWLHAQARPGDLVLFYFSGHGAQPENDSSPNYLIPSSFDGRTQFELREQAYPSAAVAGNLESSRAALRIIIIDACRDNPFTRTIGRGEPTIRMYGAPLDGAEGTLIAYAAKENQKALEDSSCGKLGMFMCHLLRRIQTPGLELMDVFRDTAAAVYEESNGAQLPVTYGQVLGRFYFVPVASSRIMEPKRVEVKAPVVVAPRPPDPPREEPKQEPKQEPRPEPPPREPVTQTLPRPGPPTRSRPAGTEQTHPKDGLKYVWIPPGEFDMGCSVHDALCDGNERPVRKVQIRQGYWLGQTEVTQLAYQKIMGDKISRFTGRNRPVDGAPFTQAVEYCRRIDGRLPTEAEWEYAARAGSKESRYGALDHVAWHTANSRGQTHDVGEKLANAWQVHDMLGNVWEWVSDWYAEDTYRWQAAESPQGPARGLRHVMRGGDAMSAGREIRASNRDRTVPALSTELVGFRCVIPDGRVVGW